jgi:protein-glutamine gamma-glutamyltransferase
VIRPVGVSAGGLGLLLAWFGGLAIAAMTGATPVYIVLAAGFVAFGAAVVDGLLTALRTRVGTVALPHSSVQDDPVVVTVEVSAPRPVWLALRATGDEVATGWTTTSGTTTTSGWVGDAVFRRRGAVDHIEVRFRTAGLLGLVWWGRRSTVQVTRHVVAPVAQHGAIRIERTGIASDGDLAGASGAIGGEIDGLRPWRDGDSEKFVHWVSSIRSGELMVHDRRQITDQRWTIRARAGTASPDEEAGAARWAIEQGLRAGVSVAAAVDADEPVTIDNAWAAREWCALAELGPSRIVPRSWLDRLHRTEPDATASRSARWWAAVATLVSLWMLAGALDYDLTTSALIAAGVVAGAAISVRSLVTGEPPSMLVRVFVSVGALGALAIVVAAAGDLNGFLSILRGPLPQALVILIILHGFECRDRRTIRVSLSISAIVLMYASGLRVDGSLGWWLAGWAIAFGVAMSKLSGPTRSGVRWRDRTFSGVPARSWILRTAAVGVGGLCTLGVLVVVPVPDGPARLTLPTLIKDAADVPGRGVIAGPDGELRDSNDPSDEPDDRAPAGQAGGYTGFSESMDTSVRGALSDEVVMRVRAPEPAFWRGQTFAEFDGRRWHADDNIGTPRLGPSIEIPPAMGDTPVADDVDVDRFVQTYYLETDMPNVVFHAGRPTLLVIDTDVWTRPDGALRATTVLPKGSVYTVVSNRVRVDGDVLARQGLIGQGLTPLGRLAFDRYLQLPASTTPETIALASELAAGRTSTYDVIRAYEAWMSENVRYDLNAPLPDRGEDAVHDLLFDSRLGFCEQIASALAVMLRTQGVPTRIATGYVAGQRDAVTGVFEVRASDAHAWVEVWFPETGWQAFDPTAAVPLSADAQIGSVGADVAGALAGYVGDHSLRLLLVIAEGLAALVALRLTRVAVARRRRGRWGMLQDRFASLAARRGAAASSSNPVLAAAWTGADDEEVARLVAQRLDRVAFDPTFVDEGRVFAETRKLVGALRTDHR